MNILLIFTIGFILGLFIKNIIKSILIIKNILKFRKDIKQRDYEKIQNRKIINKINMEYLKKRYKNIKSYYKW